MSDTEVDPRVDSAASRALGVRSIVVLPLIDGNELFGIIEILSSRPNAFGPRDLAVGTGVVAVLLANWLSSLMK